jgi:hypothetical protein
MFCQEITHSQRHGCCQAMHSVGLVQPTLFRARASGLGRGGGGGGRKGGSRAEWVATAAAAAPPPHPQRLSHPAAVPYAEIQRDSAVRLPGPGRPLAPSRASGPAAVQHAEIQRASAVCLPGPGRPLGTRPTTPAGQASLPCWNCAFWPRLMHCRPAPHGDAARGGGRRARDGQLALPSAHLSRLARVLLGPGPAGPLSRCSTARQKPPPQRARTAWHPLISIYAVMCIFKIHPCCDVHIASAGHRFVP